MWWIISASIWFLIGLISVIIAIKEHLSEEGGLTLSECGIAVVWIMMGPIMWLSIFMQMIIDWTSSNKDMVVFKSKKTNVD